MGQLSNTRHRHRRRPAGAARHRRRGGLPRPLRRASRRQVRRAGVEVARLQSLLDALQVLLPGVFVVIVVWIGARFAVEGQISPGELVAFYGYSAFLMIPLRTAHRVRQQADPRRSSPARADLPRARAGAGRSGPRAPRGLARPTGRRCVDVAVRPAGPARARSTAVVAERARRVGRARRPARPDGSPTATCCSAACRLSRPRPRRWSAGGSSSPTPAATLFTGRLRDAARRPRARRRPRSRRSHTASADDVLDGAAGRASTPRSRRRAARSPAVSGSGSCSRARWPPTPRCSCWSSRPRPSTRTPRPGSPSGCAAHRAGRTTVVTTASPLMLDRGRRGGVPARRGPVVAIGTPPRTCWTSPGVPHRRHPRVARR